MELGLHLHFPVSWTDSVPTDKADARLRALPLLFSEPVATHRRLTRNKLR